MVVMLFAVAVIVVIVAAVVSSSSSIVSLEDRMCTHRRKSYSLTFLEELKPLCHSNELQTILLLLLWSYLIITL
jgi:hypothetical protein